jgi:hypothetical protein
MAQPPFQGAGPNQVRAYLADLLIHKHDASSESAKSIADLWQLGRGRDLRQANITNFINIFGEPAGLYLYRSVREDFQAEWRASILGIINFGLLLLRALLPSSSSSGRLQFGQVCRSSKA